MRYALLCAIVGAVCAVAPMSARAQTPPRFHNSSESSGVDSPRYSPPVDYRAADDYPRYRPLWTFYYYPRGIPQNLYDPKSPGYRYYPYYEYRSSYPQDQYDRSKVQRYPVR